MGLLGVLCVTTCLLSATINTMIIPNFDLLHAPEPDQDLGHWENNNWKKLHRLEPQTKVMVLSCVLLFLALKVDQVKDFNNRLTVCPEVENPHPVRAARYLGTILPHSCETPNSPDGPP